MDNRSSITHAGEEAPIRRPEDDLYGFVNVAAGLSRSIHALDTNYSTVIGIEGQWGAGKTSLLNLLLETLYQNKSPNTHILRIAPWMTAQGTSPADSLLMPVAAILREEEEKRQPLAKSFWQKMLSSFRRKRNSGAALDMLNYLRQTSGKLAPLADFFGNFVPGMGMAAKGMETLAKLDLSGRKQTAADLHASLDKKIRQFDLKFIVIIDDLDRLEPAQAVEVLRLVRSVADFSRFRYVMCYDREVLVQAIQNHLQISDGVLYLQKIIQLSFRLPRPETFDLRRELRTGAAALYREINGNGLDAGSESELAYAVDVYGEMLTTPREVNQILNALRFCYPGLRDYVYFPDLCFLQILRVVSPGLHDWAEHYLTERAVIQTGDGSLSTGQQENLCTQLKAHLSHFPDTLARYGSTLGRWLPGISGYSNGKCRIFGQVQDEESSTALRRLGSLIYWRYYFSFSAPQNVLSEADILDILHKAGTDRQALENRLLESISSKGITSRTWFEHIITRLTPRVTAAASYEQLMGLISFFFSNGDRVKKAFMERHASFFMHDSGADRLVINLVAQVLERDRESSLGELKNLFETGTAVFWTAGFMRDLLILHGMTGDRPMPENETYFTHNELENLRCGLVTRLDSDAVKSLLLGHVDLLGYLYAWQQIDSKLPIQSWTHDVSTTDENFLLLLLRLRSTVISTDRARYYKLDLAEVSQFLLDEEAIKDRLDRTEKRGCYQDEIRMIREAISQKRYW
ncbi:KAP family P-loop NTPase fold protein [Pantoea ananatis]|uniref:KAP family P-loop NTPase fold protein n=1 Tax=Pantoea ananas TaxID=553 RepID=UPI0021E72179|nr:KAP family NTPase [Pantoea ananatis]MCW0310007.1 hypothetical protein [Pantoea ananatis]MCW0341717.1 hypothetical protein [Pantoea ananatis]MCW0360218.1 hypothetical protein [Pantoea ananatis]MCW0364845.1 hypothetical protein [Pantoea ananatis]MCW1777454.1 KAP family NTPase [Pantoea ananatis]